MLLCFEQRRKLTETEAKTIERVHRVLTAVDVAKFSAALIAIITDEVKDRDMLARIGAKIRALQMDGSAY